MEFEDKAPKPFGSLVFLNYLAGPKSDVEYWFFYREIFSLRYIYYF